jgi:hypothetical protein
MRKNVGRYERIARILLGAALTYLAVTRWRSRRRRRLAIATGLELLTSGVVQTCPANAAVGRDTYREGDRQDRAMGDLPA